MIRPEMKKHYGKEWKRISKALRDTVWSCMACKKLAGPGRVLTVHHADFNPANNALVNLVVLCAPCHLRKHGLIRKYGRDTDCQMEMFVKK